MGILFQSGQSYVSRSHGHRSLLRFGSTVLACANIILLTPEKAHANTSDSQQAITPLLPYKQLDQQFASFRLTQVGIETMPVTEAEFVKQDQLRTSKGFSIDSEHPSSDVSPAPNSDMGTPIDRIGPPGQIEATSLSVQPRQIQWKEVKKWEIAFQILNVIDTIETISCIDKHHCREMNPMFGSHPSVGRVIFLKAGTGLLHYAVTRYIFRKKPEWVDEWMITTTIAQGGIVLWNLQHCF